MKGKKIEPKKFLLNLLLTLAILVVVWLILIAITYAIREITDLMIREKETIILMERFLLLFLPLKVYIPDL